MIRLGCVGLATASNCRDAAGIRARTPEFHLFSTGWVVSHGWGAFLDFNVTVTVCGLTIRPRDFLHGDASGVLSIPLDIAERLGEAAGLEVEREKEYFYFLEGGQFTMEELQRRFAPH